VGLTLTPTVCGASITMPAMLLRPIPLHQKAKFDHRHQIAPIGRYLLERGPLQLNDYQPCFPYRLMEFDSTRPDPLHAAPVQQGA
jgi:hypothetical protein